MLLVIKDLIILLFFLPAVFLLGYSIIRYLLPSDSKRLDIILWSLACGFGLWAFIVLLLGWFGLIYNIIFYILLFITYLLLIPLWSEQKLLWSSLFVKREYSIWQSILLIIGGTFLIINFFIALIPSTFYDALYSHLAIPEQSIITHTFRPLIHNLYTFYPINTEMLYTLLMALGGDYVSARVLHFLLGILSTLALYNISRELFNEKIALLSSVIFYATPSVALTSTLAMHDLAITFFQLLALSAFLHWEKGKNKRWWLMSAIATGLAICTKYTALYFTLAFLISNFIWNIYKKKEYKSMIKMYLYFILIVLLISAPYLLRNLILTGNPVYPTLPKIFGTSSFQKTGFGDVMLRGFSTPLEFLLLPLNMTFHSERFGSAGEIGILYLLIFPFLLFIKKPRIFYYMFIFSLLYFIFWAFTLANTRYFLTVIAILSCFSAYTIYKLDNKNIYIKIILRIILIFILFLNLYTYLRIETSVFNPLPVLFGIQTRDDYISHYVNYYPVVKWANENLSEDARILFIGEGRSYYLKRDKLVNTAYDKTIIIELIRKTGSYEALIEELNREKIEYVLYNSPEAGRLAKQYNYFHWNSDEEIKIYKQFVSSLKPIYKKQGVILSEIVDG